MRYSTTTLFAAFSLSFAVMGGCTTDNSDAPAPPTSPPAGFTDVTATEGADSLPDLPTGRPGNLALLEPEEREVVSAADARAPGIRTRATQLWLGAADGDVSITQLRHGFSFGFPIELARFREPGDLDWYTARMAENFSVAVIESDTKWARVEPSQGVRDFSRADADVAWARDNGFVVKGHTLLWGLPMPLSSAALPAWAEERFPDKNLSTEDAAALRAMLKAFIEDSVRHFGDQLTWWDVTNETLQPLAQWFIDRLGPGIVNDAFAWAHAANPDVGLIFNEWIVEVFTGFPSPTAAEVRDRVLALLAAGVPINALGQQAHFAPTIAFADPDFPIEGRTRIDVYATALDLLAETGLPIHLTETNFIAPVEPELRAAQAEALMRLWWGHPAVEMIVFWGPWNKVAGRDEFDVGFWDNERNITRHGEAVFSLLNDRWRTRVSTTPDTDGLITFDATYGDYIVQWRVDGVPYQAHFSVNADDSAANFALRVPPAM
tara:strand:+ start:161 stop:1636 length:1476 start_codon:yes stop_codon:yes gene_type:complete